MLPAPDGPPRYLASHTAEESYAGCYDQRKETELPAMPFSRRYSLRQSGLFGQGQGVLTA